ncbi:acylphosphatase [Salinisphaera aquimarina]|uniref:Acylphosphatase n=1 Tax=Salinisphaera aquimarina TaxID=2094031 RepID=A0ABV7EQZ5_9GAMM
MIVRHFTVSGRVQGVGFRAATCDTARRLGLNGWVRNLADGRVEIMASGEQTALDSLRDWLGDGPTLARVSQTIEHDTPETTDLPTPFAIR